MLDILSLLLPIDLPQALFTGKFEFQWEPLPEGVELICYPLEESKEYLQVDFYESQKPDFLSGKNVAMVQYSSNTSCDEEKITFFEFKIRVTFPCAADTPHLSPHYEKLRIRAYQWHYADTWKHELQHVTRWLDLVRWTREYLSQRPSCTEFKESYRQEKAVVQLWQNTFDFYEKTEDLYVGPMIDYLPVGDGRVGVLTTTGWAHRLVPSQKSPPP